ncbi:MAG: dihydroflavonol 4-reductase [Candidatus Roseilinea sp.]|nr:MAG: dihydroflavonol 4-reductase [Candidatus Roseilinea sp.]
MLALVTGATGFIGANLVEMLTERGWTVRALRRPASSLKALAGLRYESAIGDVTEPSSLGAAMAGVDVVFHVAAVADYWRSDVGSMMRVNVDGTRHVLQAALDAGARRVVFTSSCAALGRPPFGQMLDERAQFNLQPHEFPYGYSKHLAEQVCREFIARGLDVVIVNPAVVFGPRDVNVISSSLIVEAARRTLPFVPPGGVSVVDVADVCAGHIAAAERGATGERYILTGENLTYRQLFSIVADVVGRPRPRLVLPPVVFRAAARLVDLLHRRLGRKLPVSSEQVRFAVETFWFDPSKARRELGLATRPVAETVARTHRWYVAHGYLAGNAATR